MMFGPGPERVEVWSESPILSSLDAAQLAELLDAVALRRFDAGEVLLEEGAPGDAFFLLGRGRVVVSTVNFEGKKTYVGSLSDGDCFGEQAFFTGAPRSATVEAVEEVQVLEISKQVLARLLSSFPAVGDALRRFYRDRVAESLLAKSPLFGPLGTRERKALAERFTFEARAAGELIMRRGEVSDAFYAVRSGSVEVFAEETGSETIFATLGPGEIFGEVAAFEGSRRTASVRVRTASCCGSRPPS
jgi:CRP-like cAMP-binding protein